MNLTILNDEMLPEYTEESLALLRDAAPGAVISCYDRATVEIATIADTEVLFGLPSPKLLKQLSYLKWLHLPIAGAFRFADKSLYADPAIILTKSSGVFGKAIAEHAIGMMISLSRSFMEYHKKQQAQEWGRIDEEVIDIFGSNALVLGLGDIGTEVCKRLSGFGCRITGFRRDANRPHAFADEVRPISRLRESLPDADYIILCLPGTDETTSLIGREELSLMKKNSILINVGRGATVDTDALVDALNNQIIAGAGLDVTEPEPIPAGHPIWTARNMLITPHVSVASPRNHMRRLELFAELLKLYHTGQEMLNIVDFDARY